MPRGLGEARESASAKLAQYSRQFPTQYNTVSLQFQTEALTKSEIE